MWGTRQGTPRIQQSFGGCRQDSSQTQVLTGAGGKRWQERGGHFLQVCPSPLPGVSASHLAVYNFSISNLPSGPSHPLKIIGFPSDHWVAGHTNLAGIPALTIYVTSKGEGTFISSLQDGGSDFASGLLGVFVETSPHTACSPAQALFRASHFVQG